MRPSDRALPARWRRRLHANGGASRGTALGGGVWRRTPMIRKTRLAAAFAFGAGLTAAGMALADTPTGGRCRRPPRPSPRPAGPVHAAAPRIRNAHDQTLGSEHYPADLFRGSAPCQLVGRLPARRSPRLRQIGGRLRRRRCATGRSGDRRAARRFRYAGVLVATPPVNPGHPDPHQGVSCRVRRGPVVAGPRREKNRLGDLVHRRCEPVGGGRPGRRPCLWIVAAAHDVQAGVLDTVSTVQALGLGIATEHPFDVTARALATKLSIEMDPLKISSLTAFLFVAGLAQGRARSTRSDRS